MVQSYFRPLLDTAELLGSTKTHDALLQMQSAYEQKLYFVAFIGQYSAGKSCLLNRILNRRLLPEGTTETTPLLTYIRYGEREEAKLHYINGTIQLLELEQVAQLAQQAEGNRWDLTQLEFLEVFLHEDMLRAGMVLLDTPGINTLIQRHEQLLEASLAIAASIIYVAGHAPSLVDADKLSMLVNMGFDVAFVRTHCDEIKEQEETLEQVKAADQPLLAKCGICTEQCYYVSNKAECPLSAAVDPLRDMLVKKGSRAATELEIDIEKQLFAQAKQCRSALENRRVLLEQACAKNAESLEKYQAKLLYKIKQMEVRLEESESAMRRRIESCRRTLQGEVKHQLEMTIQHSGERIEINRKVTNEAEMTELLRQEAAVFSRNAYELISASLDPLVQEVNGGISADEIELELLALPQADNYQELCCEQDEQTNLLRNQLITLQESQADLMQVLADKAGSDEYLQLQQELQKLHAILMELQQKRTDLPPYVPRMVAEEDGSMQPSQIARSIGAAADWIMLLIPGTQVEAAIGKLTKIPKVAKTLGKFVGILEKAGKAAKKGDTIKDILFTLKNISDHTRTSKRREKIAVEAVTKIAKGADTGLKKLRSTQQNNDSGSVLDLLTVEHWAGKLGEQFDRPPRLVVDKEYEVQYREEKDKLVAAYREVQQKAYQKKLEMELFQNEEQQLQAKEESLRIDQEAVAKELAKREKELRTAAREEALKKWRHDCTVWYQCEMKKHLQDVIDAYIEEFPSRLEEYRSQRLQALNDALEKEKAAYDELMNAPEDEVALELHRVNELLEEVNHVFHS